MHVIVLHKKHLSEAETVIDICICANIRDLAFSHPFPVLIFSRFVFSFFIKVASEALMKNSWLIQVTIG